MPGMIKFISVDVSDVTDPNLSSGYVALIVCIVLFLIAVIAVVVFLICRRRRIKSKIAVKYTSQF